MSRTGTTANGANVNGYHWKWKAPVGGRCQVCDHQGWCQVSEDGSIAMCRRQSVGAFDSRRDTNGSEYHLHWLVEPPPDQAVPVVAGSTNGSPDLADVDTRHAVYSALLSALEISAEHLAGLVKRGLDVEDVSHRQYKTLLPRGQVKLAAALHERFGTATLLKVPGFFVNPKRLLSTCILPGLLIPVRDCEHRIVALMVRPDRKLDDGAKYLWVSSKNHSGPSPGALPHVPWGLNAPFKVWRLTEGALKADVATVLSGIPTIGAPGATNWTPCVEVLKALGCRTVRLAFDADAWTNPTVGKALGACYEALKAEGCAVEVERWDPATGKGIDDVLLARGAVEVLSGAEADRAVAAAVPRKPPTDPVNALVSRPGGSRPRTDLGNAERLVDHHAPEIHYCHPWKTWLVWDGRRWRQDQTGQVERWAKETVRAIGAEASGLDDKDERKAMLRWAISSEQRKHIEAMIALSRSEPGIPALPAMFDADPWLLNCRNGTLDLRTGELRPHRREDFLTKLCPVDFDLEARCPLWDATLKLVFAGNEAMIRYWDQLAGMSLTGITTEQCLPILYGKGSNGKSTVVNTLMGVLGTDYAMKAPHQFLMVKSHPSHPTELADLFGMRLVVAIETGEGMRINETLIKELTGNDPIRARRMRENQWEFRPTHKVLLCTNHKPEIRGTDHAIWRRVRLLPFSVTIPDDQAVMDMPARLAAEAPGILARCVRGCLDWRQAGRLILPREVDEATSEYRREQDTLGGFLAERCVQQPGTRAKASALYESYQEWAEHSGEPAMSLTRFGLAMVERGFERKTSNGIWYLGIGLRTAPKA